MYASDAASIRGRRTYFAQVARKLYFMKASGSQTAEHSMNVGDFFVYSVHLTCISHVSRQAALSHELNESSLKHHLTLHLFDIQRYKNK